MPQQLSLCFPSTPQIAWLVNVLHSELCEEITSKNSNYSLRKICMFLFGQGKLPVKTEIEIQVQHKDSLFLKALPTFSSLFISLYISRCHSSRL